MTNEAPAFLSVAHLSSFVKKLIIDRRIMAESDQPSSNLRCGSERAETARTKCKDSDLSIRLNY